MLKLEKYKRVLAVFLAVITVAATAVTGIALLDPDKSKIDVLDNSKFESVNVAVSGITVTQNEINTITVEGDPASFPTGFSISIGVPPHALFFDVKTVDSTDGKLRNTIDLNTAFCGEFENNTVPVYLVNVSDYELITTIGVITYDYNSGILRYPAGTLYVSNSGSSALTTQTLPADAKLDADGKATLSFDGKMFTFKPKEQAPGALAQEDAPEKGTDCVYAQDGIDADADGTFDYIRATLSTRVGLEYAVTELAGSVGVNYGIPDNAWITADALLTEFPINLTPGNKYSFWVRTPGKAGVSEPSVPVFIGSIVAMDTGVAQAKLNFLKKYDEIVTLGGKKLYPAEKVTATSDEIASLVSLYEALPEVVKTSADIQSKAKYFELSAYLTVYQDVLKAADDAMKYADFFGVYTAADATNAMNAAIIIKDSLGAKHLSDPTDAEFILYIKQTVEKIAVLLEIHSNIGSLGEEVADKMIEAADYFILNMLYASSPSVSEAYNAPSNVLVSIVLQNIEEYNLILWAKEYIGSNVTDLSKLTLEELETAFATLKDVVTLTTNGPASKSNMAETIYTAIADKYIALIGEIETNGNTAAEAAVARYINEINGLKAALSTNDAYSLGNPADKYAEACKEVEFEKKHSSSKADLAANVEARVASEKYSADGKKVLAAKLAAAIASIDNLKYSEGKTISDIDAVIFAALADFDTVNVVRVDFGTKGKDYSGTVTNTTGMPSSLAINLKKATNKKTIEGTATKVITGEFSEAKKEELTSGKKVLFAVKLNPTVSSTQTLESGTYTVKLLIPKEYRGEVGLQVLGKDGKTVEIYKTVRAGAYLEFTVTDLNEEFYIVSDKMINLVWLVVVLAVILAAEIAVIVFLIVKRKSRAKLASFAPAFLALMVSGEVMTSVIVLGALSVIGGIAAAVLVAGSGNVVKKNIYEVDGSVPENTSEPVEEAVEEPVEEIAEPIEEVVEEPVEEIVEPIEAAVEEPIEEIVELVEEAVEEPVEEIAEPIEAAVEEPIEKVVEAPVEPIIIPVSAETTDENAADDEDSAIEEKTVISTENGFNIYVTYDYSFRAKLMLSTEEAQSRYALISDTLKAYGMKCRESWKKERYYLKKNTYANLTFRGKTLCVYLAIAPEQLEGTKYFYENVSAVKKYESVPVLVRIRSARACKYAIELIKMMFDAAGIEQKRPVIDEFVYKTATIEELIDMGFIKLLMTDDKGESVDLPEDGTMSLKLKELHIQKSVTVEEAAAVPDEEVKPLIETEVEEAVVTGKRKGIVNIDTISKVFNDGDTVTLQSLIAKKLLPKNTGFVKILARGTLDKALTVRANDFSMDAAKMIIIAGGTLVKLKTKK